MVASLSTSLRCHDKDKTPEMSHPEASILRLEQAPPTLGECLVTWLWDLVAAAHPVLLVSPPGVLVLPGASPPSLGTTAVPGHPQ